MEKLIDRYSVIGTVAVKGTPIPILDIPMMSDEEWQKMAQERERKGLLSPKSP